NNREAVAAGVGAAGEGSHDACRGGGACSANTHTEETTRDLLVVACNELTFHLSFFFLINFDVFSRGIRGILCRKSKGRMKKSLSLVARENEKERTLFWSGFSFSN